MKAAAEAASRAVAAAALAVPQVVVIDAGKLLQVVQPMGKLGEPQKGESKKGKSKLQN